MLGRRGGNQICVQYFMKKSAWILNICNSRWYEALFLLFFIAYFSNYCFLTNIWTKFKS